MTRFLPLLLLVLPFAAHAQDCSRQTDEFTGETTIRCHNEEIVVEEQPLERISFAALATVTTDGSSTIWVSVSATSEGWNFLNAETAYMLVDGARHRLDAYRANTDIGTGKVREQVVLNLPLRTTKLVSQAREVRAKIGTAVFNLEPLVGQAQRILMLH